MPVPLFASRCLLTKAEFVFSYFLRIGKLRSGFILYRCLRTSSALEGYHVHLRRLIEYCYAAGPAWIDALMSLFDFNWIVAAGRKFIY